MRNHLCCSALVLLAVFGCGGTAAVKCRWGDGCVCLQCPAGQEPSKACGQIQSPAEEVQCQLCPTGSFSDTLDSELCRPHTSCKTLGRKIATSGTAASDAICGDCLTGFHSPATGQVSTQSPCVKRDLLVRTVRTVGKGPSNGAGGPANSTVVRSAEEKTAEYAVFALVPIFCVMGLLGILICNILKKKGYRCTAEKEGGDEETATPQKEGNSCPYISDDLNEDTISVLVRLITEKKENAAALEELLLEYETKQLALSKGSSIKFPMLSPLSPFRSLPRLCSHQSHLHTISGLSGLAPKHGYRCTRCAQRKWPPVLIPPLDTLKDPLKPPPSLILPSLDPSTDQQKNPLLGGVCVDTHRTQAVVPKTVQDKVEGSEVREKKEGELTVLSVGRFQVAQIPEQKPVTMETKTSSQEQRNSLFGGKHFCSSSSGIRR
ncbi:tumor necrosis factor receptor superfamily member 19L isoform X1 [Amphiprion ocellaris]|uniref:TNFR-Cys domain-containing protein n=1 Tax=Amphiprion ocellaris TaxID=80972 RepID=A0A3Q1CR67_AMPOC|nr:tumor necrosis factor receptor superfamily member 19L isoform X1 [Amphiprion ocellaris]XP_023144703.2 tumor necrosis factor receptor superfamily member 19L isoform X2 [Amphiprion ocellaris]XP_035812531.2 tumor necrosis factor receptor superfamily member 19L isoform X1 [Amphiprion ocellaris]